MAEFLNLYTPTVSEVSDTDISAGVGMGRWGLGELWGGGVGQQVKGIIRTLFNTGCYTREVLLLYKGYLFIQSPCHFLRHEGRGH